MCGDIITKDAKGSGEHRDENEQITYDDAPPAFGPHWNVGGFAPVPIDDRFYTEDSRPELEQLVHNLEHGFTILWYDETAADDASMLGEIKAIADKLDYSDTNNRLSFIAAPWTSDDGKDFPDGEHIAFTHWSADQGSDKSEGIWQYCSEPSGEALETFMKDYPYYDAPEPIGGYAASSTNRHRRRTRQRRAPSALVLELRDDGLHALSVFARRDQQAVGGVDDHDVVEAEDGDHPS